MSEILDDIMNEALDDAIDKVVVENELNEDKFARVCSFTAYRLGTSDSQELRRVAKENRELCDNLFSRLLSLVSYVSDFQVDKIKQDVHGFKNLNRFLIRKTRRLEDISKILFLMGYAYSLITENNKDGKEIVLYVNDVDIYPNILRDTFIAPDLAEKPKRLEFVKERYHSIKMWEMFVHLYNAFAIDEFSNEEIRHEILRHEHITCLSYGYLRPDNYNCREVMSFPLECSGKMFGVFPGDLGKKYTSIDDLESVFGSYYAIPVIFDKAVLSVSTNFELSFCGRFFFKEAYHYIILNCYTISKERNDSWSEMTFEKFRSYLKEFQRRLEEMSVVLTDELMTEIKGRLDQRLNPTDLTELFCL